MVPAILSGLVGLVIGVFIGRLSTEKSYNDEFYSHGFTQGYEVAKDNFYNPQAKG